MLVVADFDTKRFYLRTLLWSGLLFGSRCDEAAPPQSTTPEGLVNGSPAIHLPTVTITTTIAYNPTLTPGDGTYKLLGCYRPAGEISGGHVFSQDGQYACPETVSPSNITIGACSEGCASLSSAEKSSKQYTYFALKNRGDCTCGTQLSSDAQKLSDDNCKIPCSGDSRLSCGGKDDFIVYSIVGPGSNGEGGTGKDENNARSNDGTKGLVGSGLPASTTASATAAAKSRNPASNPQETNGDKATPSSSDPLSSTHATTAARSSNPDSESDGDKGQEDRDDDEASAHKQDGPSPASGPPGTPPRPASTATIAAVTGSFSGAIILAAFLILCLRAYKRKKKLQDAHVKTVVERRTGPRHSHHIPSPINTTGHRQVRKGDEHDIFSATDGTGNRRERDIRITAEGDLVPTTPALESGAIYPGLHSRFSSAADNHGRDSLYSTLMGEVRGGAAATSGSGGVGLGSVGLKGTSSGIQWRGNGSNSGNHNNHSPSQPTPAAQPEGLGDRAWHRRKLSTPYQPSSAAQRVPLSGPPTAPLSNTPVPLPPMRPRCSFETIDFEQPSADRPQHIAHAMAPPKKHTPTPLNIIKQQQQSPKFVESPILGRQEWGRQSPSRTSFYNDRHYNNKYRGDRLTPTLPPVTPGESFDSLYESRNHRREDDDGIGSPASMSSITTSMLFPDDEDLKDRHRHR